MKIIIKILLLFIFNFAQGQTTISGTVIDDKGQAVLAANIFIDGTYDGTTSTNNGAFTFTTTATGTQKIVITFLGFDDLREIITIESYKPKAFIMRENVNTLDAVVVSAGSFNAGDNTKVTVLKPLDIVTTAGSSGNIIAALQTLPGTQTVGESGRLFVRGGEADETQTFVDGLRVAQPYTAAANNLPTRGRFSPFLFKGMTFSTGGYSAEYGEALSSVLLLNTIEEPVQEQTEVSVMSVGLGVSNTQKWNRSSLSVNAAYTNLEPYQWIVPQNVNWIKPYQSAAGEGVFRYKFNYGMLKIYTAFDHTNFSLYQNDINLPLPVLVDMKNDNLYFNTSYKGMFGTQWTINTGIAYGYSQNNVKLNYSDVRNREHSSHLKLKLTKGFSSRFKLSFGTDYFITDFNEDYAEPTVSNFISDYSNFIAALYTEGDIMISKNFALKAGLRTSQSKIVGKFVLEPRIALALKSGQNGQFSLAYGEFNQTPKQDYLKYNDKLDFENTAHYIFNYMYNGDGKTFRAEAYYKDYNDLVKFNTLQPQYDSQYNNSGGGYAQGIDIIWRDNKTIKNLEYWVSYSYIDSHRNYRNYEKSVTPSYIANNNLSIVTKYWVGKLRSQIGLTYSYNSGRPYNNPNESEFMASHTKSYNNLSLGWAYLISQQKIIYFSASNVLGADNIFGYDYANSRSNDGQFARQAVSQPASRFLFIGFFWTIANDKKSNMLENL
jgi:outer membrane cobalamin receptor